MSRDLSSPSDRIVPMPHIPTHITIIGGGQAASQLVASLRQESYAGGIRLIGDEARLPYQRPPLSKAFLSGEEGLDHVTLRPRDYYDHEQVELVLGSAVEAIDRDAGKLTLDDGAQLDFEGLVFATGARARPLPVPGARLAGVLALRGVDDALALKARLGPGQRLVVIGGGYVGLEAAATALKLGASVTVLEAMPRLLARVASPELSSHMLAVHRGHGIDVRLGTTVTHLVGSGRAGVEAVAVQHGDPIAADLVLVGIGSLPNVQLAEAAGLDVANGILVDAFMRTSDPALYAIGDCANHPSRYTGGRLRLESVQGAVDQAVTAAKALTGKDEAYTAVPWFWSDQYDERLQMAGVPAADDATVLRRYPDGKQLSIWRLRGDTLTGVEAVNASKDYMAGRRLIESGKVVEAARLADPAVGAKQLLA